MVVFTCNHCGDSLQKPKVEKHYNFVCRTVKSLTCVDCFKDFKGEEYAAHTKCITEEERYAAKGSIPNGIVKKGEVKQESWMEMIKSIISQEASLKPSLKSLFETISMYDNVPRKKTKFLNFIKSSSGGRVNTKDVEEVWNIIEKYKNNNKEQSKENNEVEKDQNVGESCQDGETSDKKSKKKKKSRDNDELDDSNSAKKQKLVEDTNQENAQDSGMNSKKSKKKKRDSELDDSTSAKQQKVVEENEESTNGLDNTSGKKSKKKLEILDKEVVANDQETQNEPVKAKKKKISKEESTDSIKNVIKKKSKKKESTDELEDKNNAVNGENEPEKVNGVKSNDSEKLDDKKEESLENVTNNKKSQKKKKSSDEPEVQKNVVANDENEKLDAENLENVTKKKSQKKKKSTDEPEVPNSVEANDESGHDKLNGVKSNEAERLDSTTEENSTKTQQFDFAENILNILQSKDGMPLKKLEKKVLKLYMKYSGESECSPKTMKKFNKKLKKLENVSVTDDVVSLSKQ